MRFARFMLEDYLATKDGAECLGFFLNLTKHFKARESTPIFHSAVSGFVGEEGYSTQLFPSEEEITQTLASASQNPIAEILKDYRAICALPKNNSSIRLSSFKDFRATVHIEYGSSEAAKAARSGLALLSMALYEKCPEFAFPLLFPRHFYMTRIACSELGIQMPPIPKRYAHENCSHFYIDLCEAVYNFRKEQGLSPVEMCVLFYGYARRFSIAANSGVAHRGSRVFLLYCDPQTDQLERHLSPYEKTVWQGSEEMFPGDIVLMWVRAPVSGFTTIWEVATPGTADPFFWTDGEVFIKNPRQIPMVSFADLLQDPVWSENPLLAAHMQNGSRRAISSAEYVATIEIANRKDPTFDASTLPPAPPEPVCVAADIQSERDVETKLLEPFLKSIGLSDRDWVRQAVIRTGSSMSSRPDYLIGLDKSGIAPTADVVFEAKKTLGGEKQKRKDMGQAVAYGNIVGARVIALFGKEGILYSKRQDGFDFGKAKFHQLSELSDPTTLAELRSLLVRKF